MTTSLPALPNPETPLAFLPPTLASQLEVSRYINVATCGMFAWDILVNIRNDYTLLTKKKIGLPTIVYFISRVAAFTYIIASTVFTIGAVGDCQKLLVAIGGTFAVSVPATSLLFYFRVRAIFNGDVWTVGLFKFFWVATLAGSLTVPFAIFGGHIGPTKHCINTGVRPFSSVGVIISTVNDTLVFIFISLRLMRNAMLASPSKSLLRSFFRGEGLPTFSRLLLQSGQEYYLITVGGNLLTMGMILAPKSLPPVFHAVFTIPNIAISNSMACRVYRNIILGRISEVATVQSTTRPTGGNGPTFAPRRDPQSTLLQSTIPDIEMGHYGQAQDLKMPVEAAGHITFNLQRDHTSSKHDIAP